MPKLASAQEPPAPPPEVTPPEAPAEGASQAPTDADAATTPADVATPSEPPAPQYQEGAAIDQEGAATAEGGDAEKPKRQSFLEDLGFAFGARIAYGLPIGNFTRNNPLSDTASGSIPFMAEAALRLRTGLEVGVYGQVTAGLAGDDLDRDCADCSVFGYRAGLQLNQHFASGKTVDPWIGVAIGLEGLKISETRTVPALTTAGDIVDVDITRSTDYRAIPDLTVQLGVDIGGPLSFGPFVSFSLAQYSDFETEVKCNDFRCSDVALASSQGSVADANTALHYWLQLGVRGNYLLK